MQLKKAKACAAQAQARAAQARLHSPALGHSGLENKGSNEPGGVTQCSTRPEVRHQRCPAGGGPSAILWTTAQRDSRCLAPHPARSSSREPRKTPAGRGPRWCRPAANFAAPRRARSIDGITISDAVAGSAKWAAWTVMIAVATKVRKRPCATPPELGHLCCTHRLLSCAQPLTFSFSTHLRRRRRRRPTQSMMRKLVAQGVCRR